MVSIELEAVEMVIEHLLEDLDYFGRRNMKFNLGLPLISFRVNSFIGWYTRVPAQLLTFAEFWRKLSICFGLFVYLV